MTLQQEIESVKRQLSELKSSSILPEDAANKKEYLDTYLEALIHEFNQHNKFKEQVINRLISQN